MIPEVKPATSELWPSWAETVLSFSSWKSSGSEPYLSASARSVACAWVNPVLPPPVICTLPAGMGSAVTSAEVTLPSRTTAVESSAWSSALPLWAPA